MESSLSVVPFPGKPIAGGRCAACRRIPPAPAPALTPGPSEERKRRLVTMGLAAAVVMLVGLGATDAAVSLRQKQEQASRLSVALRDVELLRRQALDDPEESPERWDSAAAEANRAAAMRP